MLSYPPSHKLGYNQHPYCRTSVCVSSLHNKQALPNIPSFHSAGSPLVHSYAFMELFVYLFAVTIWLRWGRTWVCITDDSVWYTGTSTGGSDDDEKEKLHWKQTSEHSTRLFIFTCFNRMTSGFKLQVRWTNVSYPKFNNIIFIVLIDSRSMEKCNILWYLLVFVFELKINFRIPSTL